MTDRAARWYLDAIIYELHVKAFYDSNDDGIGDFEGLTQRLDYLQHHVVRQPADVVVRLDHACRVAHPASRV